MRKFWRSFGACGPTPRNGTFAAVPVLLNGTSTTTYSSGDAIGAVGVARDVLRVRDDARLFVAQVLPISSVAPLRRTIATSSAPD